MYYNIMYFYVDGMVKHLIGGTERRLESEQQCVCCSTS